ncbi:hypothetical protein POL68_01735 [Stigmatella sp. ncwal1]|uniref:Uncharacterized protein n=1 Tax=Stigmatella ashevillensis TaxID=2995309 RepID=A0ABT5D0I1_9BACT|nr:hypothetical protein [Stigmatella ashevillena]MDC0707179.1 hypothetical protein [Stigmatella ashevillena]
MRQSLRFSLVLSLLAASVGAAFVVPAAASAADCTPYCYKHPITGAWICTPPCP